MSESDQPPQLSGLVQCFEDFNGAYCVRKLVQLVVSLAMLLAAIVALSLFIYKYKVARPYWLASVQILLILTLLANILFCFFNEQYWLYAIQSFFYNTYYLVLVSYICFVYILKNKAEMPQEPIKKLQIRLNQDKESIISQKIIFFCVVGLLLTMYLAIFIVSVVYEVQHDTSEFTNDSTGGHYCEQIWYLVFNILCIVLSIVVVIIMLKIQHDQQKKLGQYGEENNQQQNNQDKQHSAKAPTVRSSASLSLLSKNVNNPFKNLWIWVGLNALSQVFNLVESGLYLNATPPQCLIIQSNPSNSNILSLIFVFVTMYLGFASTLWYIVLVKLIKSKASIDRSVFFSEEVRVGGNIQLFIPSKEQTITLL